MAIGWCSSKKTNVWRNDELMWNERTNEPWTIILTLLMEMRNVKRSKTSIT
jgi:hypothetical protein